MEFFQNIEAKIKSYEDAITPDGEVRLRVICSVISDNSASFDDDDLTGFIQAENQRSDYSLFIPKREGMNYDSMKDKLVRLDIYKESVSKLTEGQMSFVTYEPTDGDVRPLYSLTNCYIAKTLTSCDAEFTKMQNRLRNGIDNGEFEVPQEKKEEAKPKKAKINF